jgi:4-amino-4-deoxy-L-arabinose transferase-like glycosyltransferase
MPAYKIFGVSEVAARLGPAIAGVLALLAVYWVAKKVEASSEEKDLAQLGLWSTIVAATTLGIIVFSRAASFDILLTMTVTWALAFYVVREIEKNEQKRLRYTIGFYTFIGLSLLAKGLVGLLPVAVVAGYLLARRQTPDRRLLISVFWGVPLALAVAAIWYAPMLARHGALFVREFFLQHHFARYLSNRYNHPQPFFFYVVILVPLTLPWTPFLLNALSRIREWHWRGDDAVNRMRVLSFVSLLLPTLFFSFSGSKLPGYILPALPAAALLTGERVTRFVSREGAGRNSMKAIGLLSLLFATGAFSYSWRTRMVSTGCAFFVVLPLISAGLLALFWTRLRAAAVISVAVATVTSLIILLNCGVSRFGERESVKELIQAADARGYAALRICGLHLVDRSAEFYGNGRLVYGPDGQPVKFEGPAQVVELAQQNDGGVLVLVPVEYVAQLTTLPGAAVEVIDDNEAVAIVAVRLRQ